MDEFAATDLPGLLGPPAWVVWRKIKTAKPSIVVEKGGLIDIGFKRELIYSGRANDIVRFTYREFTEEGFARPAFTQDVTYTMETGTDLVITFRGREDNHTIGGQ